MGWLSLAIAMPARQCLLPFLRATDLGRCARAFWCLDPCRISSPSGSRHYRR
jgi:hypothetical protein